MKPIPAPPSPPSGGFPIAPAHRLLYLDAIRGAAILQIVWFHALGYARHQFTSPISLFFFGLTGPAVPFFFLADGFFFARSVSRRGGRLDYGPYVRKSAWRLLLPWAFFTAVYVLLRGLFEALDAHSGTGHLFQTRLVLGRSPVEILRSALDSSIAMQMYFLPALFLIRLPAFATAWLVRLGAVWALAAACGIIEAGTRSASRWAVTR